MASAQELFQLRPLLQAARQANRPVSPLRPAAGLRRFRILDPVAASPEIARLDSVSRLYGTFAALRQVTIGFHAGRCYVLLGDNGAGKSTLLRTLAGLLRPTFGKVTVFGQRPEECRDRIGYMSHAPMLYDELTGLENLRYFAGLYRTRPCLRPEDAMRAAGLDPALPRPIAQYSQGMRQRASLARVLLPQPELLLLDEPFSNMDAASARQMLALLAGLRAQGRAIILTTHQRDLAAPLADAFVTMQAGAVVSIETASEAPSAPPQAAGVTA
jgi:heme ABC exporter ATP-binding subunit CcmA